MADKYENSSVRVLDIYNRLLKGEKINKKQEAADYGVSEKTISRDFDDIRTMLSNDPSSGRELIYDRSTDAYIIKYASSELLTGSEILAVCKILLDSRSMVKDEMLPIIDKLIKSCAPLETPERTKKLKDMIANEKTYYIEPHHGKSFIKMMWDIGIAVEEHRLLKITYTDASGTTRTRKILPMGIMFSEYYFYMPSLVAGISAKENENGVYVTDTADLTIDRTYRIDRIDECKVLKQTFSIPYKKEFNETEFRKSAQFMFGGPLQTITFRYHNKSIEHVLDRLPSAKVISHENDEWTLTAKVFGGKGLEIWINSQGDLISDIEIK